MPSYFPKLYDTSLALLTDLYQLTMAQGYWQLGMMDQMSCFHLFFRKKPFQGSYAITAGLEAVIEFVKAFHYDKTDIDYLSELKARDGTRLFQDKFLKYLASLRITCDIDAVEEGTVVFPYEPLIRVKGPLLQAQLLETPLLNLFNFQTLIATKAARVCRAAYPDEVVEFGVRRAQGMDGALSATRSAYIGGCHYTSNLLGGKLFGIPVSGTQAHSWVMAHDTEEEAFENFAKVMPGNCVFLIDTYNSLRGAKKAIEIAKLLHKKGVKLLALRLDSGDLADLSIRIRQLLDQSGLENVKIMATNELDELIIRDLKQQGAQINLWGVGTNLVTGKDQPALDGVYKLAALQDKKGVWRHVLKISESMAKITNPGILQLRRFYNKEGYCYDVVFDELCGLSQPLRAIDPLDASKQQEVDASMKYKDLLIPIFREGKCCYKEPSLTEIRTRTYEELGKFSPNILRFLHPHYYFVGLEEKLYYHKLMLIQEVKNNT
ncbi:MAG: nicotinate phosphoribosyltransferase [Chlamydiae bacterium]|nr:nicotinate phosphoribosyltransferase [Chlamydiota bacterium]